MFHNRLRDRMLGALLDGRRERDDGARRHAAERDHVHDLQHAARQRTGLVERHAAHAGGPFEVHAALDEHAFARRASERRHNGDGGRDDERTRAGDDEQHESTVDPGVPTATHDERWHSRESNGECDDRRRVDTREAFHKGLRRCSLGLGALDQVNDARQRGIAPCAGHAHVERTPAVDRAGEDLVTRSLVGGQRFAGDG